jgi:hypothetical protein
MLNIRGEKIFTQTELMDNLAAYIDDSVGGQDQFDHIDHISGYVAGMIIESEHYVQGYLKKALRLER